jgi:3-oxoacyl-[acyl-carrier-protein] synthase-1
MTKTSVPELCVTGTGLATSVGHSHRTACASIRAGLKRPSLLGNYYVPSENPFEDPDDGYVAGHPVLEGDYDHREPRMAALLAIAFRDLAGQEDPEVLKQTPLFLALPDRGRMTGESPDFTGLLADDPDIPDFEQGVRPFYMGHAGMILAMMEARNLIFGGRFSRILVAGTDSLIGFADLSRFNRMHRLKTCLTPEGLMPGEAASVLLLESRESALARNARIHGVIRAMASAMDENPVISASDPTGFGLSRAINSVFEGEKAKPSVSSVISDLNGESYRTGEWAMIQARTLNSVPGEKNGVFPARCTGDTGSAWGGLACALAVRSLEKGYAAHEPENRPGLVLVLGSSDTGERGALLVDQWKEKNTGQLEGTDEKGKNHVQAR